MRKYSKNISFAIAAPVLVGVLCFYFIYESAQAKNSFASAKQNEIELSDKDPAAYYDKRYFQDHIDIVAKQSDIRRNYLIALKTEAISRTERIIAKNSKKSGAKLASKNIPKTKTVTRTVPKTVTRTVPKTVTRTVPKTVTKTVASSNTTSKQAKSQKPKTKVS